jgi:TonB-linked SusC/RagA family outer membrane protein
MKKKLFLKKWLITTLLLLYAGFIAAQQIEISGVVTESANGEAIPGVSVVEKGTTNGTITDLDGRFSLSASEEATIVFSFIGFATQEIVPGTSGTYNVQLEPAVFDVDEVVVTALGLSREKKSLGYTVTEVQSDEVSTVKETNVMNSLAGKVAGVTITQGAFGPGGGSRVVIRGNNSLSQNNQPLYVVDGVPIDNSGYGTANSNDVGSYSKTDYGTGISDINPDDVASISVLKGPNAAALYGSRAANGVILITTKRGSAQKGLGVTVSSSLTFERPMVLPEYQNKYGQGTQGYVPETLADLKEAGGSWGPLFDGSQKLYWTGDTKPYTAQPSNVEDFFETGQTLITSLALEGGEENANVRFSYTNTHSSSILPNSGIDRHNFNLRGFAKMGNKLTIDAKATYFHQHGENRPKLGTEGVMAYVYSIPRNAAIDDYRDYQNPETLGAISHSSLGANPYWMMYNDRREDWRNRFTGFVKVQYEFTDWLSAFVRVGSDFVKQNIENLEAYGHWYYDRGRFSYNQYQTSETNADFLFMFDHDVSDYINLSATFGGNHMYTDNRSMRINGEDFRIPEGPPVSISEQVFYGYSPLSKKKINSLYGTASFGFDNWFYLEGSLRNDWSSSLPEDSRSYSYPSLGASVLLNELLDIGTPALTYSKLRLSWAQVGNDTDPYMLNDIYYIDDASGSYLGLTTMSRSSQKNNADLRPEEVTSLEFGGEFRFLNNRLYTDFSFYDIKSRDLIFAVPISASTGYSSRVSNVGEIENRGFEILLGGTPLNLPDFSWDLSVNFSTNKNELNELIPGTETYPFGETNSGNIIVQGTVGGGFGDIYGTDWLRNDDGELVVDEIGRPRATTEKVKLGNYQPDWVGGLTNTLKYRDITLRFLIDARIGGEVYSGTDASLDASGVSERTLKYREDGVVLDAVVEQEGGSYVANDSRITAQQYWGSVSGIGSEYVYDQTNIRLREASLVWNVPNTLLGNGFVKSASVGVVARNLFFLFKEVDNFDPELSYSTSSFSQGILYNPLPSSRSFGFNVNLKF